MTKLTTLLAAAALVVACNNTKRDADKAADKLHDKMKDVGKKAAETGKDVGKDIKDVNEKVHDMDLAKDSFEMKRQVRLDTVNTVYAIDATQPNMISTLATTMPITDESRSDITAKLSVLQMRLDDLRSTITGLQGATAADFKDRDDAVSDAIGKVNDARKDAWNAVKDAKHLERPAS